MRADPLEDAAHLLARKLCGAPRQQNVRIMWQESPELSGSIKREFLSQLSACGITTGASQDLPLILISIRPTASKLLLVANLVDSAGGTQVRMAEMGREALSISNESSRTPRLQRKLLWQQERPLASAMEWYSLATQEHFLFLVNQDSIVRLRSTNDVWSQVDSAELPKADRPSRLGGGSSTFMYGNREPQAKLELLINRQLCEFAPAASLSLTCNDSHLGGKQLRMFSECGNTPWSLWSDSGDYAQRDSIFCGASEVAEPKFPADEATSHSLEMPGPVLDISTTVDAKAAIAVVRNLATGNYEVYRITLACAN